MPVIVTRKNYPRPVLHAVDVLEGRVKEKPKAPKKKPAAKKKGAKR